MCGNLDKYVGSSWWNPRAELEELWVSPWWPEIETNFSVESSFDFVFGGFFLFFVFFTHYVVFKRLTAVWRLLLLSWLFTGGRGWGVGAFSYIKAKHTLVFFFFFFFLLLRDFWTRFKTCLLKFTFWRLKKKGKKRSTLAPAISLPSVCCTRSNIPRRAKGSVQEAHTHLFRLEHIFCAVIG